jgi:DNA-binding MarR family transcriptional regulator
VPEEQPIDPGSPFALLDDDETDFWYSYMKVLLRVRYEMNRQLRAASGISMADYDVLVALTSEADGRLRVGDLAVRIGWERSRLSHHVARMRDRGLLETGRSAEDQRAMEVSLSAEGRRVLAEATPGHVAFLRAAVLDALSKSELAQMHVALDRVYDALIEHGSLPRPADHP